MRPVNQQPFVLQLSSRRPLVPLSVCMVLLDCSEDEVLQLVEAGDLRFAWDLRSRDATRRDISVWRSSVSEYVTSGPGQVRHSFIEAEVLESLFPHSRAEVKSTELQRMFSCSSTHIMELIRAGELDGLNEPGHGPDGFVRVTRASVVEFLKRRRVV